MIKIGKIVGARGLKGELKIMLFEDIDFDSIESIFIEDKKESFIPYDIISFKAVADNYIYWNIMLEGIDSKTSADVFKNKDLYLEETIFEEVKFVSELDYLKDFTLFDKENEIGKISNILDEDLVQPLLVLVIDEREIYIPFVEELILDIIENEKKIIMDLPDGILNL